MVYVQPVIIYQKKLNPSVNMLSPRLTNCVECENISNLIAEIDCKLTTMSMSLYNTMTLMVNRPFYPWVYSNLLNFKRILMYKQVNPDYAIEHPINKIASKVKLLIKK